MASTRYSILLLQKLLSLRDGISPLTLILDTLQEPGTAVLEEFMLRAKAAGTRVLFASSFLASPRQSPHVDVLVERRRKPLQAFRDEIIAICRESSAPGRPPKKTLVVIDSLCQIAQQDPLSVAAFVSSLVSPTASVLGLYHADEEASAVYGYSSSSSGRPSRLTFGKPPPLRVLCHLATALVRVHPLHEEVARKRARDRCEEEPRFGWTEGEGVLYGSSRHHNQRYGSKNELLTGPLGSFVGGVLLEMELRRRSGRAVVERFVVMWGGGAGAKERNRARKAAQQATAEAATPRDAPVRSPMPWEAGAVPCSDITVMADHVLFAAPPDPGLGTGTAGGARGPDDDAMPESTFSMGLTEKQKRDREGIVLPYFDAQTDIGAGEGGRILYDMGREDDFDDEEDEI